MESFRFEVRIAAQHLPIFVAGNSRNLGNREASFEKATCTLMSEVMKMKIFDLQVAALATEGGPYRPAIVWKNSPEPSPGMNALLLDDRAWVIPADIE